MISVSLGIAITLGQAPQAIKVPIYNSDQKTPAVFAYATMGTPQGFKEGGRFGEGIVKSDQGQVQVTLLWSKDPFPSLLRNPKYTHLPDFTTIRMTKWIGFRNSRANGEDYKLDWTHYRLNFSITYKDKKNLPALRKVLHNVVDSLVIPNR